MATNDERQHEVSIDVFEIAPGCFVFQGGQPAPEPANVAYLLGRALTDWLASNPNRRVRAATSLVAGGNTVGIYLWLDAATEPEST